LEHGLGEFEYILGERGNLQGGRGSLHSHAWVQRGPLIVDITADQFPEIKEAVIVTTTSTWHRTFELENQGLADYRKYDELTVARLGGAYEVLKSQADGEDIA